MGSSSGAKRGPVRADAANVVRGQRTRERLLHCARQRIQAHGFEALRLDDLAGDAEITKAAVVKSVGGKATILLALGEEDRQTRVEVIRAANARRTALKRRIADLVRELYALDIARLNVVMAWIGYQWFWSGDDQLRAQAMIDDTRLHLRRVDRGRVEPASGAGARRSPGAPRDGGLRDRLRRLRYGRATLDDAVATVIEHALD
jgi:AcrR family transcriptional regulator